MEGVIYSYNFLLNPFPSLLSAPNLFKASNVFASVATVPAHNILGVVVACCSYVNVCYPALNFVVLSSLYALRLSPPLKMKLLR